MKHTLAAVLVMLIVSAVWPRAIPAATAGNRSGAVTVSSAADCSKAAAKRATVRTSLARRIKKTLGKSFFAHPNGKLFGLYHVGDLLCSDVTGDGRREMAVLLQCCTVSSPSPWAVFKADSRGRWKLAYWRINTLVFELAVDEDGDVEAKMPDYQPGDANCCPSAYTYRWAHWNGSRFVTLSPRNP